MEQYVDFNAATTVASGGYTSGSGVLNVISTGSPFPSSGTFTVLIQNNSTGATVVLLRVTAVNSGTQWAVTAEGTDASASAAFNVYAVLSVLGLNQIRADQNQFGPYASLPTSPHQGDTYKCTDAPYNFICGSGGWQAFLGGTPVTIPPPILSSVTATLSAAITSTSSTTCTLNADFSSVPATPFYILIGTEQMTVTGDSSGTLTITRGDGGTTAATHLINATVTILNLSITNATSNTIYTQGAGFITLENTASVNSHDYVLLLKQKLAFSAPYTVIVAIAGYNLIGSDYVSMGIGLWDPANATEAVAAVGALFAGISDSDMGWSGPQPMQSWSGSGNFFGALSGITQNFTSSGYSVMPTPSLGSPWFLKFVDDGTNWKQYFSWDNGNTWTLISTVARNTFITPGYVGPFVSPRSARIGISILAFAQISGVH